MENSRIMAIFILLAIMTAITVGIFGRKRGSATGVTPQPSQQAMEATTATAAQQQDALQRASYTIAPPFENPFNEPEFPNTSEIPPKKPCGCGMKK